MEVTKVKEKPILFNGDMVRAILDGRKTQTRRVMKPQPKGAIGWRGGERFDVWGNHLKCPYGSPGSQLWVRETWAKVPMLEKYPNSSIELVNVPDMLIYRADGIYNKPKNGWKPSIHMPRKASRIQLEITDVRVERLQEISEADAREEGVTLPVRTTTMYGKIYTDAFKELWDSINKDRGFGWEANPWVWVVEFKKV